MNILVCVLMTYNYMGKAVYAHDELMVHGHHMCISSLITSL